MPTRNDGNGWSEDRKYVLKTLERLSEHVECLVGIKTDIAAIRVATSNTHKMALEAQRLALANKTDIAVLKVKFAKWGVAVAAIPTAATILWQLLVK